jgi:hypothetical protein
MIAKWGGHGRRARQSPKTCRRRQNVDNGGDWRIGKPDVVVSSAELVRQEQLARLVGRDSEHSHPDQGRPLCVGAWKCGKSNDIPKVGSGRDTVGGATLFHHHDLEHARPERGARGRELTTELVLANPDA